MAQTIGTIVLAILALIVIAAVLNFVLGLLGIVLALVPLLIKLAFVGGVIYLCWMVVRKFADTAES
jgi:hypothetical protein